MTKIATLLLLSACVVQRERTQSPIEVNTPMQEENKKKLEKKEFSCTTSDSTSLACEEFTLFEVDARREEKACKEQSGVWKQGTCMMFPGSDYCIADGIFRMSTIPTPCSGIIGPYYRAVVPGEISSSLDDFEKTAKHTPSSMYKCHYQAVREAHLCAELILSENRLAIGKEFCELRSGGGIFARGPCQKPIGGLGCYSHGMIVWNAVSCDSGTAVRNTENGYEQILNNEYGFTFPQD